MALFSPLLELLTEIMWLLTRYFQWVTVFGSLHGKCTFCSSAASSFSFRSLSNLSSSSCSARSRASSANKHVKNLSSSWCFQLAVTPLVGEWDHWASWWPCSLSFLSSSSFFSWAFWALVSFLQKVKTTINSASHHNQRVRAVGEVCQCVWDLTVEGAAKILPAPPDCITLRIMIMSGQDFSPYLFFLGRLSFTRGRDRRSLEVKMGMQHTGENWDERRRDSDFTQSTLFKNNDINSPFLGEPGTKEWILSTTQF